MHIYIVNLHAYNAYIFAFICISVIVYHNIYINVYINLCGQAWDCADQF